MEDGPADIRSGIDDRLDRCRPRRTSRLVRNLTFILLLVGLYVFIIAAGTDDETLFWDGDTQMP